jgi:photosystem II stability/assembly factor-like uncharacterized protein
MRRLPIAGLSGLAGLACAYVIVPMTGYARVIQEPQQALAWQASAGPFTGIVRAFAEGDGDTLYAWVDAEVFRSRDDGVTWNRCESQPQRPSEQAQAPAPADRWFLTSGRRLYASGGYGGFMQASDDECVTWRAVMPPPGQSKRRAQVAAIHGVLFAVYDGATSFTSRDDGQTWIQGALPGGAEARVATRGNSAYLIMSQRLYRSTDSGATWSPLAPEGPQFQSVMTGGNWLYATASGGIWRSQDDGATWVRMLETGVTSATVRGERIYASVFHPAALARSADHGSTWTRLEMPLPGRSAIALLETRRGTLLAGTGRGIFRSTDAGERWIATGVRGHRPKSLVASRGRAYASLTDGSFWESQDAGATWSLITDQAFPGKPRPLQWPAAFWTMLVLDNGERLRAGTDRELVASEDGGRTWSASGLNKGVTSLVRLGDAFYAGTWEGVFRSEDLIRWTECSSGLQVGSIRNLVATPGGDLIAMESYGQTYRSSDKCGSWWKLPSPVPLPANPNRHRTAPLLASDDALGVVIFGDGIAQLPPDGRAWLARAKTPLITAFARDAQGRHWLGTRDGVSRLSVEEPVWTLTPTGLDGPIGALAIDPDGYLLAAVDGRGIFRARLP